MFSMAVNTFRPKKKDSPQSKAQPDPLEVQFGPPKVLNAVLLPLNRLVAFSIAKLTVPRLPLTP